MQFYVLEPGPIGGPYDTEIFGVEKIRIDTPNCPVCGGIMGSLGWIPPYKVEIERHRKFFGDLVKGTNEDFFVTEPFRQAWLQCGLQGIDHFDPTEIVRVKPKKAFLMAPTYWHINVKRTATAADLSRSTIAWDRPLTCDYCGYAGMDGVAGFTIDEGTWTGEDIFFLRKGPNRVIVTQRFAEMIKKYQLTNAQLIPVEEYIFDPLHKLTPKPIGCA